MRRSEAPRVGLAPALRLLRRRSCRRALGPPGLLLKLLIVPWC